MLIGNSGVITHHMQSALTVMVLSLMRVHADHIRQSLHAVSQKSLSTGNIVCKHCCLLVIRLAWGLLVLHVTPSISHSLVMHISSLSAQVTCSSRCAAKSFVDSIVPVTCHICKMTAAAADRLLWCCLVLIWVATTAVTFIC